MKKAYLMAAAALAAVAPAAANAAAFQNGSFEMGPDAGSFTTLMSGSTAITGWRVGGDSIDYIGSYWQHADGNRSIDLNGNGSGQIAQTFDTIAGQLYRVTFSLAGNPDGSPTQKTVLTIGSGGNPQSDTFDTTGRSRDNMGWTTYDYSFTAGGAQSTLTFFSLVGSGPYGPALDNVSVTAVPEPAAWAMMIGGVGLIGGSLRRRKAQVRTKLSFA